MNLMSSGLEMHLEFFGEPLEPVLQCLLSLVWNLKKKVTMSEVLVIIHIKVCVCMFKIVTRM